MTAEPARYYQFTSWSDGVLDNPRVVPITQDSTFAASFKRIMLALTVNANDSKMGVVSGSGNYPMGDTVEISATPHPYYQFTGWSDGNTDNPRQVVLLENTTLTATFERITAVLTVVSEDENKGTTTGSGTYPIGSTVEIEAIPEEHYYFSHWQDGNTDNPRHVVVPPTSNEYTAYFEPFYSVTIDVNGGVNTMGQDVYYKPAGSTLDISNPTREGYKFVGWERSTSQNISNFQGFTTSGTDEVVFDGETYYDLGQEYMYEDAITVNVWAYMDNWADYIKDNFGMRLFSCAASSGFNLTRNGNYILLNVWDADINNYQTITYKKSWADLARGWHMFSFTMDGETLRLYIDGKQVGNSVAMKRIGYSKKVHLLIGTEVGTGSQPEKEVYFEGKMKNFCILPNALSAEEISDLYEHEGLARYYFPDHDVTLKAVWKRIPQTVDLGLPSGTLWSDMNLEAMDVEDYGGYFAFGETKSKTSFSQKNYPFYEGGLSSKITKYTIEDGVYRLLPEDDAANVQWGGKWRMPTKTEWQELKDLCTWTKTERNGVKGYKVKSKTNGNSIFLPAGGYHYEILRTLNENGYYWSSDVDKNDVSRATVLAYSPSNPWVQAYGRWFGISIRPVQSKDYPIPEAVDLGLPSKLKWASANLGGAEPTDCGNYFAWGETEPKHTYSWDNYLHSNGSPWPAHMSVDESKILKYNSRDNKYILEPQDDAATVNLGSDWRTPNPLEWSELISKCTWELDSADGIKKWKVTGPNGNHILIPVGNQCEIVVHRPIEMYYYWTSGRRSSPDYGSLALLREDYKSSGNSWWRYLGRTIRPVQGDGIPACYVDLISVDTIQGKVYGAYYKDGTTAALRAYPKAGYRFSHWEKIPDGEILYDYPLTLVVTQNMTFKAYFVPDTVDLGLPSGIRWAKYN